GTPWQAKAVPALPHPLQSEMPMATATETDETVRLAAERGYTLLTAQFDPPATLRAKADKYARWAAAAGHARPLERLSVARLVYVTDSVEQALEDLRPGVNVELSYQKTRGLLRFVLGAHRLPRPVEDLTFDDLVELGVY